MRIQPRQQLLEIWQAVARSSARPRPDKKVDWIWGGRSERNSISDAEQLLCLLGPATAIPTFKLDLPDQTADDVLESLRPLGDSVEIPQLLVRVITDYLRTYADESGNPTFPGGSYFTSRTSEAPTKEQLERDVVDSFSVSVRLSLAIIGFVKVFRTEVRRPELRAEVDALESLASARLSAAMLGLLRSFAIFVFDSDSPQGMVLTELVGRSDPANKRIADELQEELRDIKAGLRDVTLGSGRAEDIENENKLFECGWSWGVVRDAPQVETTEKVAQPEGVAQPAPYLYFTVVALDCIQDLFSERTRILGLLTDEQQRLSRALQLRWDMTQSYWSRIARFGVRGHWPLEDIPWRTTDGIDSDYFTLLVTSIVVQELSNRRAPENDVLLVGQVLRELAGRARITRRMQQDDPAISLHSPGYSLDLEGSEEAGGPPLRWLLGDFSPQLLKQTVRVASLLQSIEFRGDTVTLADQIWEQHLRLRQLRRGSGAKLWDQTRLLYGAGEVIEEAPSWYYTERVVDCLVDVAVLLSTPPLRSPTLTELSTDLLAEADHLFDQQLLAVSAEAGPTMGTTIETLRGTLRRAHEIQRERPGAATALSLNVLRELEQLAAARQNATRNG
jgi:hypothetical protein